VGVKGNQWTPAQPMKKRNKILGSIPPKKIVLIILYW